MRVIFSRTHQLAAFENQRLEVLFFPWEHMPSNRAPLLLADLFLHTSDRKNGSLGVKELAQREQGGKSGKSQRVAAKSAVASRRSLSNPCPGEPLAMSPFYQHSCMRCTSLAVVWLALFWV